MTTTLIKHKIISRNGKPEAVILGLEEYERLLETAEDKEDLAEIKQIKKGKTSFRRLEDYLKRV